MAFVPKDIENLLAVAQTGDFAQAARTLGITASALRSSIRRVEEAFGLELLKRNARGARMTEMGERFIEAARRLSSVHTDAVRVVAEIREGRARPLRLAFSESALAVLMAPVISATAQAFPDVPIVCRAGLSNALIAQGLAAREIDMAVIAHPGSTPAGCDIQLLGSDTLQLLVSDGHPMARRVAPSLRELAGYRWSIALPSPSILQALKIRFENEALPMPDVAFQFDNTATLALSLARQSRLVTLATQSQCLAGPLDGLKVLRVDRLDIAHPVHLLTRNDAPESRAFSQLRESIIAHAAVVLK